MKIFIMISWRNIWRHKRRSMVVISSMALGIFAMIVTMSLMNGFNVQMVENTINTSLGHIAIHNKGFQDNMKLSCNFQPTDQIYKAIKDEKEVISYTPRIKVQGMVRSSETSRGVLVVGIDPEKEKKVSKIYDYTSKKDGSEFLSNSNEDEIIISSTMAKKLDLLIGDKLNLMIQNQNNKIEGVGLRVKGLYTTPVDSFDKLVVFIGLKKLQDITGLGNNISEITIITKNRNTVNLVKKSIIQKINDKNLEILSWEDMAPHLVSAVKLFDNIMYIFFLIIFMTVVFSVANTLIMAIMERFHEIGVMKSIGTRPSKIFFMIFFEAINLGIAGLFIGVSLGSFLVTILSNTGIDFSFYMESMRLWGTGSIVYPVIKAQDVIMDILIVLLTTCIAALYPAVKAARIKPLEALNYI